MTRLNLNEVRHFEDGISDLDVIKDIIGKENNREPFFLLDVADVIQKQQNWIAKMPRVVPFYAIKCNPNSTVIKILADLNGNFDCASKQEIEQVMKHNVAPERIIFAHPAKCSSHITYARKMNVKKMTVDSEIELLKINNLFPEAEIVIRIRCDAMDSKICLGSKFGCEADSEAIPLIKLSKSLDLRLIGFSFHVGSPCSELNAYRRGIDICKKLIAVAKTIGCNDIQLIDIGGGFLGDTGSKIDETASIINDAIKDVDPSIKIISEPGQYYVSSAISLVSNVHTKKLVFRGDKKIRMYYMDCGVYNGFLDQLLTDKLRMPTVLRKIERNVTYLSTIWGPTADSTDCVVKDVLLPEFNVDDCLIWKDMGSYTMSLSCPFNGFELPTVYPFVRKSQWESYIASVKSGLHYCKSKSETKYEQTKLDE